MRFPPFTRIQPFQRALPSEVGQFVRHGVHAWAVQVIEFAPPGPPSAVDFRGWLARRTPADAPTLVISLPGDHAPLRLPLIRTPALAPPRRRGRRGRGLAPALHTACLVDIAGLTHRQVAASGLMPFDSERAARQHARDGRFVASELGLWPWAAVGGRSLPRVWWLDDVFAVALERWATAIRVPDVEPTVRRLRLRLPA